MGKEKVQRVDIYLVFGQLSLIFGTAYGLSEPWTEPWIKM